MNSKEAFRIVRWAGVGFTHETFLEASDILLKDLEALEILKSHARLTELNSVYTGEPKTIAIIIEPNDDGYEIVKRWLENERN